MKSNDEIAEFIMQEAMAECKAELAKFRQENAELIGLLIEKQRHLDFADVFFKHGFAKGLKFGRTVRDKINQQSVI